MCFKNKLTFLSIVFFSLLVVSLPAQNKTFQDFDTDGDNKIERHEFQTVFMKNYTNDLDFVDNPGLDDEDFFTMTYAILDSDNNKLLVENEWKFGYDYYFNGYVVNDFWVYDIDGDGYISYAEYMQALSDTDYYMTWDIDRDNYLDEFELANAVFDTWDVNDNGILNQSEFYRFDVYYSDI